MENTGMTTMTIVNTDERNNMTSQSTKAPYGMRIAAAALATLAALGAANWTIDRLAPEHHHNKPSGTAACEAAGFGKAAVVVGYTPTGGIITCTTTQPTDWTQEGR